MRVALLTGGMKAAARRTTLAAIRNDEADLIVGTHAILSEGVEFARLGLAVVDEQHRFGVRQRGLLAEKAANPHLLVMSATPIPRTLGLLMYGDLDISILDELPPGRKPVKTRCITGKKRADLYGFLDREIDSGRQVYIVCPAIEDAGGSGLNAVKSYYEDIAKAYLPDRRVGLMHGKLKPKEKAEVMDDFKSGRLDALVSTTVIEVGVDVPNATVMVIENAERYGLSALHQLRGRVGRGAAESWCFLVSDNASESVQKRLKFLCSTSDGFAVAQYDLETRGPGDFFGSRQHGLPTLQIADLMNDTRTLHAAQIEAVALLAEDPLLERPEHVLLARQVEQMFDKARNNELVTKNGLPAGSPFSLSSLPPQLPLADAHYIAEEAAALGRELHILVMAAEEPFLVSRFHDDLVEEEVQPVILALCQHAEIQKFAWRVVGQHIIYLPAVRFQRGLAAGVFLVRRHLLRPPVDVGFPLFLVRAFRSAEAEVLLPFQLQYAAPADVVHIAAQRLHQPAEPLFGGVLFQQVIVLVAAIEEKDGVRPLAQPVQILLLGLAAVPHKAKIAQHNDEIALCRPGAAPRP